MNRDDAIRLVDAFVDNELDVKDALEIQALLEEDESLREEYERVLTLKSALRNKIGEEGPAVPELLKKRVTKAIRRESLRRNFWYRPSIAAAAVISALILGWGGYQRAVAVPASLVADTMMIYRVERGNPLDIRSNNLKTVSSWLDEKFQEEVKTLRFQDGEILGARLCPFAGQKGVLIRYRVGGKNVALFIGKSSGIPYSLPLISSFEVRGNKIYEAEKDTFRLAYWKRGIWFYALVLEEGRDSKELRKILSRSTFEF